MYKLPENPHTHTNACLSSYQCICSKDRAVEYDAYAQGCTDEHRHAVKWLEEPCPNREHFRYLNQPSDTRRKDCPQCWQEFPKYLFKEGVR